VFSGRRGCGRHLGAALGGAVEAGAAQEEVDLLPGLAARLFGLQEALDLWTGAGLQQLLGGGGGGGNNTHVRQ